MRQEWGVREPVPYVKIGNKFKDDIMRQAVLCKFQTHRDIRDILLSTGNAEIVENSPIDFYWGCGADGSGKNMLGKILVEVRDVLLYRHSKDINNKTC